MAKKTLKDKLLENLPYKIIALLLAIIFWYVVNDPWNLINSGVGEAFTLLQ